MIFAGFEITIIIGKFFKISYFSLKKIALLADFN